MDFRNQKLIFADTTECDDRRRGTPVFGTQRIALRGNVFIELDVIVVDSRGRRTRLLYLLMFLLHQQVHP